MRSPASGASVADGIDVTLVGWDKLDRMMADLGPQFTPQCVTRGVFAASQLLKQEMKSRCPVGGQFEVHRPGQMRDAIDVLPRKYKQERPDVIGATISPTFEKADGDESPGYYCTFVEYGSVHNPQPEPFMRNTMDEAGNAAIDYCIEVTASELEKMSFGKATVAATEPPS
jgi:hypothetical protein